MQASGTHRNQQIDNSAFEETGAVLKNAAQQFHPHCEPHSIASRFNKLLMRRGSSHPKTVPLAQPEPLTKPSTKQCGTARRMPCGKTYAHIAEHSSMLFARRVSATS